MMEILNLSCGIRLVYEYLPYLRSVATGVWVASGSRYEDDEFWGASHFIEHMLFKGTTKRTARDIAEEMDAVGGQINAFTTRDCTCYYIKTLDTHLDVGLDILSDMLINPIFDESDIDLERGVIIEEINMYEDSPEELVHDMLSDLCYNSHPIGRNILGSVDSLNKLDKYKMTQYMQTNYTANKIVISIAGSFDVENIVSTVEKYFGEWPYTETKISNIPVPVYVGGEIIRKKQIEQAHLCIAYPGIPYGDKDIYALSIVNNILGGGMSSKLFQQIREKMGLAYSIYSYPTLYEDTGYVTIYAGCKAENVEIVMNSINEEIDNIKNNGILNEEFLRTKEQLKGNYILSSESTNSRMSSMGRQLLLHNRIRTESDIISAIDNVDMQDIKNVIDRVFNYSKKATAIILPE